MKLRGEILSVESTGDGVRVNAQFRFARQAKWVGMHVVEFCAPLHEAKSYHVGRIIQIEVTAR
jgi:hypothetical protein